MTLRLRSDEANGINVLFWKIKITALFLWCNYYLPLLPSQCKLFSHWRHQLLLLSRLAKQWQAGFLADSTWLLKSNLSRDGATDTARITWLYTLMMIIKRLDDFILSWIIKLHIEFRAWCEQAAIIFAINPVNFLRILLNYATGTKHYRHYLVQLRC